jgi:hypothetical protein
MSTTIQQTITAEARRLAAEQTQRFKEKLRQVVEEAAALLGNSQFQFNRKSLWISPDMVFHQGHHIHKAEDVRDYAWGAGLLLCIEKELTARHEARLTQELLKTVSIPPSTQIHPTRKLQLPTAPSP